MWLLDISPLFNIEAFLYTYPIKSLRSVPLTTAIPTPYGFPYDRRFMLIKIHPTNGDLVPRSKSHLTGNLENMTITYFPELALFLQSIDEKADSLTVTYCPPGAEKSSLTIPLEPDVDQLERLDVQLHKSPTKAHQMQQHVNEWFSSCFGYEVILVYLGLHKRPILGNVSPKAVRNKSVGSKSWLSSIASSLPSFAQRKSEEEEEEGITFTDLAAYLVVTEESLHDLSSRFSDGTEMDVTKFRPNVVVSGSGKAFEEDYWAGITITNNSGVTEVVLTANCARCVSINVDYNTGQAATGEAGNALKKLMKDRRIDKGAKWSPIFGRYGFLKSASDATGRSIAVGDMVEVNQLNKEHTTLGTSWEWKHILNDANDGVEWPGLFS